MAPHRRSNRDDIPYLMLEKLPAFLKKVVANAYAQKGTLGVAKTLSALIWLGASIGCLKLVRISLALFPAEALARFKAEINPTVSLDYDKADIRLVAENIMSIERSYACRKEPETIQWIEQNVKKNDVFYDVGANVGAYSLVAEKFCGSEILVYAFEPSFATFHLLCRNIILNHSQRSIFPYMICLSEKERIQTLNYFSIEAGESKHTLGDNYVDCLGERFAPAYQQSIFGYSIDALVENWGFPPPHLMKLDVDGTELQILQGAAKTLKKGSVRSILVEVSTEDPRRGEILSILDELGFALDSQAKHPGIAISNLIFNRTVMK